MTIPVELTRVCEKLREAGYPLEIVEAPCFNCGEPAHYMRDTESGGQVLLLHPPYSVQELALFEQNADASLVQILYGSDAFNPDFYNVLTIKDGHIKIVSIDPALHKAYRDWQEVRAARPVWQKILDWVLRR